MEELPSPTPTEAITTQPTPFKQLVEERLTAFLGGEIKAAPTPEARLLLEHTSEVALRAGKRFRPELLRLTYESYGGKDHTLLIDIAGALELHHQSLLVHDDITDNDIQRYDGPNVIGYYEAESMSPHSEVPKAMGLISGNLLFSFAIQLITQHPKLTPDQRVRLLNLLNTTHRQVHYGQQLDILKLTQDALDTFTVEEIVQIHTLKTAWYTTRLPMLCAAELLKLDKREKLQLEQFAMQFGTLYQLIDDYSDYFPNPSALGNRPKYRDYREGKLTLPLYYGLQLGTDAQKDFLRQHLGRKDTSNKVMKEVTAVLKATKAREAAQQHLETFVTNSLTALQSLSISKSSKQQLQTLVTKHRP